MRPGQSHAGRTQGRYVDNVGVVSHGDPALHTEPGMADAAGFGHFAADFCEHHRTTATESGRTYMEYELAYRYGYDVGERYPDEDWETLEAGDTSWLGDVAPRHPWPPLIPRLACIMTLPLRRLCVAGSG